MFLIALAAGLVSYLQFERTISQQKVIEFEQALSSERLLIEQWMKNTQNQVENLATSPSTKDALLHFADGWTFLGDSPGRQIETLYRTNNPRPE